MTTLDIASVRSRSRWHADRLFYTGMATILLLTVFAGFAKTYYLKGYFNSAPLSLLVHLHAAVCTAWLVLFFGQTVLVATRQVALHRKLGMAGIALATAMVLLGICNRHRRFSHGQRTARMGRARVSGYAIRQLRILLSQTPLWLAFADWLKG